MLSHLFQDPKLTDQQLSMFLQRRNIKQYLNNQKIIDYSNKPAAVVTKNMRKFKELKNQQLLEQSGLANIS